MKKSKTAKNVKAAKKEPDPFWLIEVELNESEMTHLHSMLGTGLYGRTHAEAIVRILDERLQRQ